MSRGAERIEQAFFERVYRSQRAPDPGGVSESTPPEIEDLADRLEPLAGRRVLDLGAGEGRLSAALARRGARVTALDLSSEGLLLARSRMRASGLPAGYVCGSGHELPFRDGAFDRVAGALVLHHLDLPRAAREVRRLLVPGGRAAFRETLYTNPVLFLCREYLAGRFGIARVGTPGERPLGGRAFRELRCLFRRVEFSYPDFLFFRLFDRNVFRYTHRVVNRLAYEFDRLVHRHLPFLRRYSYQANLVLER